MNDLIVHLRLFFYALNIPSKHTLGVYSESLRVYSESKRRVSNEQLYRSLFISLNFSTFLKFSKRFKFSYSDHRSCCFDLRMGLFVFVQSSNPQESIIKNVSFMPIKGQTGPHTLPFLHIIHINIGTLFEFMSL